MKSSTRLLTAVLLGVIAILPTSGWAYDSPTDAELEEWWGSLEFEDRMEFIRQYDRVEHSVPELTMPDAVVLLVGQDIHITYPERGEINVGHLSYGITLPVQSAEKILPKHWAVDPVRVGFLATGVSLVVTAVLTAFTGSPYASAQAAYVIAGVSLTVGALCAILAFVGFSTP